MTIRLLSCCLLCLICLLPRHGISQMYRLSAGDIVRGRLIGLDTAIYCSTSQLLN